MVWRWSSSSNEFEEIGEVIVLDVAVDQFLALAVHQANVHLVSVQIDSAVEVRSRSIILHIGDSVIVSQDTVIV